MPQQEDINAAGMENNLRFTSFCFDPAAGVYFAHARFYDAGQGRMFGRDPMKRGVNAYPYCDNDPVNHVDPTGEIPTILAGGLIGGAVGAFGGFVGSAVSQYTSGEKFSVKKAIGSAANGAIVGAARGAMVGSGIGAVGAFAVNFGAGALGSAAEQKISTGKVSFGDSMVGGLINGVSGAIYGNNPLGSVKSAFGRGALAGGATAGINNLYNVYKNWKTAENGNRGDNLQSGYGWLDGYSYGLEDTRGACGTINPLMGLVSASLRKAVGYAYKGMNQERQVKKKSGFDAKSFVTDVAIGSFTGGTGSVMFYGADKMASALRGSIRGNKGGSAVEELTISSRNTSRGKPNAINHFGEDLNTRQRNLLNQLPEYDSSTIVRKSGVNLNDLSALTAKTGDEFAMFTRGSQRLIVRGGPINVNIDEVRAQELASAGYRWSGHTHPGIGDWVKTPSTGDELILNSFKQTQSAIYDSTGKFQLFGGL